ncbi:DUF4956 domain-containing protein [Pseudomonadota bacterium]
MDIPIEEILVRLRGFDREGMENVGVLAFFVLMAISLISSMFISALYMYFYESRATGSQIHRAFPLLGISVTAIFICIQFSLPLSLGLLGALSIVRFRTPIKEPEEIGFIMLLIATSIAVATFNLYFLVVILVISIIALLVLNKGFRFVTSSRKHGILLFSIRTKEFSELSTDIQKLMENYLIRGKLDSITKSEDDSIVSYSFRGLKPNAEFQLQNALGEVLQLRDFNLYFTNRPDV